MQDDPTDAVKGAVVERIADTPIAIFGVSYGGYAALAGAAFTPDLYRCAIDLCGPSNVATCINLSRHTEDQVDMECAPRKSRPSRL